MTDTAPLPPAPIVPDTFRDDLVAVVIAAAAVALAMNDTSDLDLPAGTAVDLVAVELDRTDPFPDVDHVPPAVVHACVVVACDLVRRPGFAFGVVSAGEAGQPLTVGRDPLAAVRGQLRPYRRRWGVR